MNGEHRTSTDESGKESRLRERVEWYFAANPDATVIDALGGLALSPDHRAIVEAVRADSDDGDGAEPASTAVAETRVVHRSEPHDVYIGRGRGGDGHLNNTGIGETGWLGNPYKLDDGYSRKQSLALYWADLSYRIKHEPEFSRALAELKGQRLACYCRRSREDAPDCHGDVLVRAIEGLKPVAGSGSAGGSAGSESSGEYGESDESDVSGSPNAHTSGASPESVAAVDTGRERGRGHESETGTGGR